MPGRPASVKPDYLWLQTPLRRPNDLKVLNCSYYGIEFNENIPCMEKGLSEGNADKDLAACCLTYRITRHHRAEYLEEHG